MIIILLVLFAFVSEEVSSQHVQPPGFNYFEINEFSHFNRDPMRPIGLPNLEIDPVFTPIDLSDPYSFPEEIETYYREQAEESRQQRQDALQRQIRIDAWRSLLFPSATSQSVGRFFGSFFGAESTNRNLRDVSGDLYKLAYPNEYKRFYCKGKLDESYYFTQGTSSPTGFLHDVKFIYGMFKDYYSFGLYHNNQRIKNLYTFSWHFNHPFSQEQFDDMGSNQKRNNGLHTTTGEIGLRLGFNQGQYYSSMIKLKPGETTSNSFSIYLNESINLSTIHFIIIDLNENQNIDFFPSNRRCNNKIGCIFELNETIADLYGDDLPYGGSVYFEEGEDGHAYDNQGIIIGGGVPPSEGSSPGNYLFDGWG